MANGTTFTRIRKRIRQRPARAAASTSFKTARSSPPLKSSKALLFHPTTLLKQFSKTAGCCATRLSPKFAPSPLPTTPTMILRDALSESVAAGLTLAAFWRGHVSGQIHSRAAQFEALDFSRYGFRQLRAESHFSRNFVRYEPRFDVLANFRRQLFRSLRIPTQYHVGDGIRESALIGRANHRGLGNIGMPQQRVLHFHRRNPHSRDFQHVVRAPAIMVVALGIAKEFIAGRHPITAFRARRQFGNAPVFRERARAAHPQSADFAVTHRFSRVVHDFDFVAWHGETATARLAFPGNARYENMQHFRGADAVENFNSESPLPSVENFSRQRLAGRHTLAHRRKIDAMIGSLRFPQHCGIKSWHREKNGRPVTRH